MISAIKQKNRPGNLFRTIFLQNEKEGKRKIFRNYCENYPPKKKPLFLLFVKMVDLIV